MEHEYNAEAWYPWLALDTGIQKRTSLGLELLTTMDEEEVFIANDLWQQTGTWTQYEDIKNELGKKAKPVRVTSLKLLCLSHLQAYYGKITLAGWIATPGNNHLKSIISDAWHCEVSRIRMPELGWTKPRRSGYVSHCKNPGRHNDYFCQRCLCIWKNTDSPSCCRSKWAGKNKQPTTA